MANLIESPKSEPDPKVKSEDVDFKAQYKKRFEEAVTDAQHLLMYASSNCPNDIDRGTLEKLIAARRHVENNESFSPKEEADFWLAYQNIWKLVQPVTAESIKANLQNENTFTSKLIEYNPSLSRWLGKRTSSRAGNVVNRYIIFTVFVLVFLLILQIYWVIGNQLTTQLSQLLQREAEINLALNENQQAYSTLEILYKQNEIDSESFQASGEYNFYKSPEWERDTLENISTRDKLEDELVLLKSQLERNSAILLIWSGPWKRFIDDQTENTFLIPVTGSDESANLSESDKFALQIESKQAQIDAINLKLLEDFDGMKEAQLLNSTLTPLIDGIDEQLALLYADNTDLYVFEAEIQKQIEDINAQLVAVSNGDVTTVSNLLTEQLNILIQQKDTIDSQIEGIRSQPSTDAETGESLVSAFEAQLAGLEAEKASVENEIAALENQLSAISGNTSALEDLQAMLLELNARKDFNTNQIQSLEAERQNLISQLVPAGEIVNQWQNDKQKLTDELNSLIRQQQADARRESSRQAQLAGEFVLVILQSYILPLLYGILGASTSVLRSLSKQVEKVLYSEGARIQHLLRISLGALAGIMVGWFSFLLPNETTTFVGSVSPLAIAFLVGYNIELFFSLMDSALFSITDRLQRPSPTEAEEDQKAIQPEASSVPPAQETPSETPPAEKSDIEEPAG